MNSADISLTDSGFQDTAVRPGTAVCRATRASGLWFPGDGGHAES
nr:hypothetical protein [uncultured bacterium]